MRTVLALACCLALGLVCLVPLVTANNPNTCNRAACSVDSQYGEGRCGDGFCCNATGTPMCINPPATIPDENVCNTTLQCTAVCMDGSCDGRDTCGDVFDAGSQSCTCTTGTTCDSGVCYNGACASDSMLGWGEICATNAQCLSNMCDPTTYTCTATPATEGQACNSYTPCAANLYCLKTVTHRRLLSVDAPKTLTRSKSARRSPLGIDKNYYPGISPRGDKTRAPTTRHVTVRGGSDNYMAGTCQPKTTNNTCPQSNIVVSEAQSSTRTLGRCTPPLPKVDYNYCPTGSVCNSAIGECYQLQQLNQACNNSIGPFCADPLECNLGKCVAPCSLADGAACEQDDVCMNVCITPTYVDTRVGTCGPFLTAVNNLLPTLNTVAVGGACSTDEQCIGAANCVHSVCTDVTGAPCGPADGYSVGDNDCGLGLCVCGANDFGCVARTQASINSYSVCLNALYNYYSEYASLFASFTPAQMSKLSLGQQAVIDEAGPTFKAAVIDFFCCAACGNTSDFEDFASGTVVEFGYTLNCVTRTMTYAPRCAQNTGLGSYTCPTGGSYVPVTSTGITASTGAPTAGAPTAGTAGTMSTTAGNGTTTSAAVSSHGASAIVVVVMAVLLMVIA